MSTASRACSPTSAWPTTSHAIVKGLRAVSDFDYELQMAQMNSSLAPIETVFVPDQPRVVLPRLRLVKEVATFGGDVSGLVPAFVLERLTARLAERREAVTAAADGPFCPTRHAAGYDSEVLFVSGHRK